METPRSPFTRGDAIPLDLPPSPLVGFLPPEPGQLAVLFGDGGSGKGTLAAYWAAQATIGGGRVLIIDAEGHPREWARRIKAFGGAMEQWVHWAHPGGSLLDGTLSAIDDYRDLFDLVVVDSAAYFHGKDGDQWGPSAATDLQRAAVLMGVPVLVIAHVSKHGEGSKAYGSSFWHNVPRATYSLDLGEGTALLTCHKATDLMGVMKGQQWRWRVTYAPDGVVPISWSLDSGGSWEEWLKEGRTLEEVMAYFGKSERWARSWVKVHCRNVTTKARATAIYVPA